MRPALGVAVALLVLMGAYHFFVVWHQHRMEGLGVRGGAGPLILFPAVAIGLLLRLARLGRHRAAVTAGLIALVPTVTGLLTTRFAWAVDQTWAWVASIAGAMAFGWLFSD